MHLNGFSSGAVRFEGSQRQARLWDTAAKFLPTGNPAVSPTGVGRGEFTQTERSSGLEPKSLSVPLLQTLEAFPDLYVPPILLFESSPNAQTPTAQGVDSRSIFDRKPTAANLSEQARENVNIAHLVSRAPMKEIFRLKSDIYRAFSIPGVREVTHMPGLFAPGNMNLRGAFQEDLAPVLQYRVDEPALVNISVFTQEAHLVRSVSQGFQTPGAYRYVWDFRNDAGDNVRKGYYVGVVTMGVSSTMRKAIQAP